MPLTLSYTSGTLLYACPLSSIGWTMAARTYRALVAVAAGDCAGSFEEVHSVARRDAVCSAAGVRVQNVVARYEQTAECHVQVDTDLDLLRRLSRGQARKETARLVIVVKPSRSKGGEPCTLDQRLAIAWTEVAVRGRPYALVPQTVRDILARMRLTAAPEEIISVAQLDRRYSTTSAAARAKARTRGTKSGATARGAADGAPARKAKISI